MKKYIVTVNGVKYEVEVEEVGTSAPAAAPAPAPAAAPAPAPAKQQAAPKPGTGTRKTAGRAEASAPNCNRHRRFRKHYRTHAGQRPENECIRRRLCKTRRYSLHPRSHENGKRDFRSAGRQGRIDKRFSGRVGRYWRYNHDAFLMCLSEGVIQYYD